MNTNESKKLDTRALCIRILEEYGTIKRFANRVKMKPDALMAKLEGKRSFYFSEVTRICKELHLRQNELNRYFFTEGTTVSKTEIQLAELFLTLTPKKQSLILKIMELVEDDPARMEMMESWTGKYADLPAALAQI